MLELKIGPPQGQQVFLMLLMLLAPEPSLQLHVGLIMVACLNLSWGYLLEHGKFTSSYSTESNKWLVLLNYILLEFWENVLFSMS